MNQLFSINTPALFVAFALAGAVCFALCWLFLGWFHRNTDNLSAKLPLPTFIGVVTTTWALALGFAAADVWEVRNQAQRAAAEERSAILRLVGASRPEAMNRPELVEELQLYTSAIIEREWPSRSGRPSQRVDNIIQSIRVSIIAAAQDNMPGPLVAKMVHDFDQLQDARNERLALKETALSEHKWYLVFFLTVLSMITIVLAHADRPAAGRNALAVFTVAAFVSLWILALHANPFGGPARVVFHSPFAQIQQQ